MIQRLLGGVASLVSQRPRAVLLVLGLITALACSLLPRLRVDPDVTAFLPRGDPMVGLLTNDAVSGEAGRRLWIAIEGNSVGESVQELASDLAALAGVERVLAGRDELLGGTELPSLASLSERSLAALEHQLEPEQRRAAVADIRRTLGEDPIGGQERVLRDPLGLRWALAEEQQALPVTLDPGSPYFLLEAGDLAILSLEGEFDPFDVAFSTALMEGVENVLGEHGFEPGVTAHILGGYAVARGDAARIRGDLTRSLIWSIPLVMLFLMLSARSFLLPHLYLAPVLVAIVWALGFGSAILGPLTPLALSSAAILTGLGVDFALHLSERWREERRNGSSERATAVATIQTGRGLLAAMLTSAAAFLSFSASSLPGLVSFGLLLAIGLASALVVTLFLEPLLLERFVGATPKSESHAQVSSVVLFAKSLSRGRSGPMTAFALIALGLIGWGVVGTRGLAFDADPSALRPADTDVTQAAEAIQRRLSFSPIAVRVLVPMREDLANIDVIASGAEVLRESGMAALVVGPQSQVPNSRKRAQLARLQTRGESLVAETEVHLVGEGLRPEPFRSSLNEIAQRLLGDAPVDAPEFRVALDDAGGASEDFWRVDVYPRGDLRQREERGLLREALGDAFGDDALIADPHSIGDLVTPILRRELSSAVQLATGLVLLFVMIGLGGIRPGLLAMVPVCLGFGLTLGLLSILGIALTPGNLMAIPLILGLGVDDGVHLVLRRLEGGDPMGSTGTAIWRTSATTALGFGSLITAQTPSIASLGAITLIGVMATLVTSLLVLPAFWSRADGRATKGA